MHGLRKMRSCLSRKGHQIDINIMVFSKMSPTAVRGRFLYRLPKEILINGCSPAEGEGNTQIDTSLRQQGKLNC